MLSAFLHLWLVVRSWSLCLCVQHEQSFYNVLSQKSNDNNSYLRNVDMLTHRNRYHLIDLFALVTIVWDPDWYDFHRRECIAECIQFGRCFLGAFSFYAAEVGRTKLRSMSLRSAQESFRLIYIVYLSLSRGNIPCQRNTEWMDHEILVKSNTHGTR